MEYLQITFSDVVITSFQEAGGEEESEVRVGFSFARIEMQHTPQKETGAAAAAIKAGWDLSERREDRVVHQGRRRLGRAGLGFEVIQRAARPASS